MAIEMVGQTEEMRHIPPLPWLIEKLDREVRSRLETLYTSCFESERALDSSTLSEVEGRFRQICRWLERLGEQVRGKRAQHNHDFNLRSRVRSALSFAIESLGSLDPNRFRQRTPFHQFERSRSECIYAAFLTVSCEIDRLVLLVSAIDPDLPMKLNAPPESDAPPVEEQLATTA